MVITTISFLGGGGGGGWKLSLVSRSFKLDGWQYATIEGRTRNSHLQIETYTALIYLIQCSRFGKLYVGETENPPHQIKWPLIRHQKRLY